MTHGTMMGRLGFCGLAAITLSLGTGCMVVDNKPAPGRLLQETDPEMGRPYNLYVPSRYASQRKWPLVVTCHGTRPYDSADLQINEWKGLAEEKNLLVVAPKLIGTVGDFVPPAPEQVRRQLEDESAILSIVRTISAAYNVDETRVFLTGWSAGGYAVLFTGLRNPDTFRALSLRQTNFDPAFVEPCVPFLDRTQPIQVMYGNLDPLRSGATKCIDWLRAHEFEPTTLERAGSHRRDPMPVYNFFAQTVRGGQWVRVQVREDPDDPMRILFSVHGSFEPVKYLWDFGDGSERVPVAAPEHRYTKPGLYNIRVGVWAGEKTQYNRQVQVQVPRLRLGARTTTRPQ